MTTPKQRSVWLYLVLVGLFSLPWWALMLHTGSIELGRGFVIHTQMWAPAMAALMASWLMRRSVAGIGWGWGRTQYVAAGYLIPVAYSLLAYVPIWIIGLAPPAFGAFAAKSATGLGMIALSPVWPAALQILLTLGFGVVQSAASAAGEEIGWRGYLVPALFERFGFGATVWISGIVWACWHMPLVLFADYHGGAPEMYSIACFTVMIIASGAIAAWLRLRSGSVWPCVLLHATHNAVVQWLFDPMTSSDGHAAWFAGEFGVALALSTTALALVICTRPLHRERHTESVPARDAMSMDQSAG